MNRSIALNAARQTPAPLVLMGWHRPRYLVCDLDAPKPLYSMAYSNC